MNKDLINIKYPKLYKLGFLPNTNKLRNKQKLPLQEIANLSQNINVCNNINLYPFPSTKYDNGKEGIIDDNCNCISYFKY